MMTPDGRGNLVLFSGAIGLLGPGLTSIAAVLCEFIFCFWSTVVFILFNCIPKMSIFNHRIVISMSFTNLFDIQESDINTLLAFQNSASLPPFYTFPGCVPTLA